MANIQTALVTGATRGVGAGIARALSPSYQVWATGRTIATAVDLPDSVRRIACDHKIDSQTDAAFGQIPGDLDVLVNSAWGGYDGMVVDGVFTWSMPFWEGPARRWDDMIEGGVRPAFACSVRAARRMVPRRRGLIVNISFWAAKKYVGNVVYGISKAAVDKMTGDMARELRDHNVTVISLYPGLVRTEAVLEAAKGGWLDLGNSESPEFSGLVIDALARDPHLHTRTGQVLVTADLAIEYGVLDVDGKQPAPLTLEKV